MKPVDFLKAALGLMVISATSTASARYLEPEPMWQTPQAALYGAYHGIQVPVYAYAANNPVNFVDRNGLWVITDDSSSPDFWKMFDNPYLAPFAFQMLIDPNHGFAIRQPSPADLKSPDFINAGAAACGTPREASWPQNVKLIVYDRDLAPSMLAFFGYGEATPQSVLAHELGHAYQDTYGPPVPGRDTPMDFERSEEPPMLPRPWHSPPQQSW